MLANHENSSPQVGALSSDVQKPATFRHELIGFIASELPVWRGRPDRRPETSETTLTSHLCAHLNSAARRATGWDLLQFRVEEPDEQRRGRKIDLVASPCGTSITIEGRRHSDFDSLMPLECKRLPTPKDAGRDEREYVISAQSTTGGIQRFKAGNHGALHKLGAIIGYVQEEDTARWNKRVAAWITALADVEPGWTIDDLLVIQEEVAADRLAILRSTHRRQNGLSDIELRHLWIEMN